MKKKKTKRLHPTGQLSIFVVLIFQALFILFAMSLNVALVVHDKINLQNSVDIAAYYGAMKQAEMMNAIAHINYQIRQSWKLLVWRYRVLGSMGVTHIPRLSIKPSFNEKEHIFRVFHPPHYPTAGPYFFCVGHKWWGAFAGGAVTTNEDRLCIDVGDSISPIAVPSPTGSFWRVSDALNGIKNLATSINFSNQTQCNIYGYDSWLLGVMTFMLFHTDQSNRKYMIKELAEALKDGKELPPFNASGTYNIEDGVEETFKNNLSYINKDSYNDPSSKLEQFSSLDGIPTKEWLGDKPFVTEGLYADLYGGVIGTPPIGCSKELAQISKPARIVTIDSNVQAILDIINYNNAPNWPDCIQPDKCKPSAGIYKKDNFLVFYSVKAEINYKNQIFLPLSRNITLKAKATAMPFGGIIGPPPGTDNLLPPNSLPSLPPNPYIFYIEFDRKVAPNYSRYPGDPYGLRSSVVHNYWNMKKPHNIKFNLTEKNTNLYLRNSSGLGKYDSLARMTAAASHNTPARRWELEAISPDLFDVTYFTILPYYTYSHFPRVQSLLGSGNLWIRGDLGTFKKTTSDFDITKAIWDQITEFNAPSSPYLPFYTIKNPALSLTGWNPPKKNIKMVTLINRPKTVLTLEFVTHGQS